MGVLSEQAKPHPPQEVLVQVAFSRQPDPKNVGWVESLRIVPTLLLKLVDQVVNLAD